MQNTQQSINAEFVTNMTWNFMNHVRGNFSIGEIFTPTLAVLYAFHKGYAIRLIDNIRIEFIPNSDRLFSDLANLIPNDKHLHTAMCQYIRELSHINREDFNSVYVEVLRGLFDLVSCNSGRDSGEFYTPSAITKLMAYIVNKEGCNKVFDPFCGTASIIHELSKIGKKTLFIGQELNFKTSIYARINAEALYGHGECIKNVDSIRNWDKDLYHAVVSCPPFALRLTPEQLYEARHFSPECPCRSYEEIILTRPFYCNNAKLSVMLLPTGVCFRGNRDYELRKDLVEHNLLDKIIALPANILYGTSIPSVVFVCKRERKHDEPIKFIHAEDYFLGERRKRTFDYDRFIEMIEGDACDVANVPLDEVRQYDYNLNPALYYKKDFEINPGQKVVRLEELITPIEGNRIASTDGKETISVSSLSRDFINILLNNGKTSTTTEVRRMRYRLVEASEDKYILSITTPFESRYAINTDGKEFVYPADIKIFKVNENLVIPEYLVYTLLNHRAISKGRMPLSGYMMLPIVIDSLETQKKMVDKEILLYNQKLDAEREADALRLGVKQNVSDLEHMLGSTQLRITKIITRLEKVTPTSENYHHLVKSLKDNVEYMNRIIHYNNARIDTESFNLKRGDIAEFINAYVDAWNNYGGEYFKILVDNRLDANILLSFDKTLLTVMLDSILNNAIRHGFHKRKNYTDHNMVQISLSAVEYNGLPYMQLTVANNGDHIAEGFTIKDYISRGRYTTSTGRSGLGGYHVYQIVKGHNGFLYLDSNKVWNMIVEVLLPIETTILNELPTYDNECI